MANTPAKKRKQNKIYNQTLSKYIKKLYLESETADVHFTIESDDSSIERVPVHKSLLAAVSDVFKTMFYGELKEEGDVHLNDVTVASIKEFLQFFYLDQIKLTEQNVVEVMHLGHKYNVIKCMDVCVRFVKDTLNEGSFCTAMNIAILYDQVELMKHCDEYLITNTDAVFKSSDFLECDKRLLEHILKMNLLSCSESDVFEACMSWVKFKVAGEVTELVTLTKELVQEHLGDLFYDIRFSSMDVGDFIALSLKHDYAFSPSEYKDVIQTFTPSGGHLKLFNGNPRQAQWNEHDVIICDRKVLSKGGQMKMPIETTTEFTSNETILLGGLVFAKISVFRDGSYHDLSSDFPINISVTEVRDQKNKKTLSSFKATLPSKLEKEVLLPKPVIIRRGQPYQLQLKQCPEGHSFEEIELKSEVSLEPDNTIKFKKIITDSKGDIVDMVTALLFNKI